MLDTTRLVMEKFAVDLDRVLDEFEYSEDNAERVSDHITRYASAASEEDTVKKYVERKTSKDSICHGLHEDTVLPHAEKSCISLTNICSVTISSLNDESIPCTMECKGVLSSTLPEHSCVLSNTINSNVMLKENRIPLSDKINVSGVFSCLNEYINSGSATLTMKSSDCVVNRDSEVDKSMHIEERFACEVNDANLLLHSSEENMNDSKQSCDPVLCSKYPNYIDSSVTDVNEYCSSVHGSVDTMKEINDLSDVSSNSSSDDKVLTDITEISNIQVLQDGRKKCCVSSKALIDSTSATMSMVSLEQTDENKTSRKGEGNLEENTVTDKRFEISDNNYSESIEDSISPHHIIEEPFAQVSSNPDVLHDIVSNSEVECVPDDPNKLGTICPFWIPDDQAPVCMLCGCKFTVLKRRHHCRACGKVFCSKCCCQKYRLKYLSNGEVRVCHTCFETLTHDAVNERDSSIVSSCLVADDSLCTSGTETRQPNPNNPMEYCSTIPPLEQAASALSQPVPSVLVPVGVLKREGSTRLKTDIAKQVMFSDGIRPGGDLLEVGGSPDECVLRKTDIGVRSLDNFPGLITNNSVCTSFNSPRSIERNPVNLISSDGVPPLAVMEKGKLKCEDIPPGNMLALMVSLRNETDNPLVFALNKNLFVKVKILDLDCCVNRKCWCFSTIGMSSVGQDEVVIVLECLPDDTCIPKDIFHYLYDLYHDASRGNLVTEMGHSTVKSTSFLGSPEHGGFLFIRPSFQCLQKIIQPPAPYLVGILIHRWEIPWAKVFPIRLMLRLGAEYRYYPCMLVSVRLREAVYCEIGHTIINLLADFNTMRYTLPCVRGMVIHMQDRQTSVLLPKNRYDQVARALSNSNDHVLALAANFSLDADSHLVCIQSSSDDSYHTQAINIHNKPRKVTGASFIVFNGALKISSNLKAKSTIVEDGLMVQITQDMIQELRSSLHRMKDFVVKCGPSTAHVPDEVVELRWVEDDNNFNMGVKSVIDDMPLDGVPSIRVHNGSDFFGKTRFIRWTEVFLLQTGRISDGLISTNEPIDVSRIAENLATATCMGLCDFLDLLAQGGFTRIAVRANIHQDNVGYVVGSQGEKLAPIYMKTLDSTLVPVLHHTANMISDCSPLVLELLFHIMFQ